jgi:hypothetical protein
MDNNEGKKTETSTTAANQVDALVMPTAGPWERDGNPVDYDTEEEAPWLMQNDDKHQPAKMVLTGEIKAHNETDVRLIAAAPDLLNACQHIMKCFGASTNWNGETEKAIAVVEKALARYEA